MTSRRALACLGGAFAFVLAIASALLLAPAALGQTTAPVIVPLTLAPLQRDTPLELVALTLDAEISESNGHTLVVGNSTFKIHNSDRLDDLQVPVGFPSWAGDPYTFDPTQLISFTVSVDGQRVKSLTPSRSDLRIGGVVRTVDWYTFTLSIAGDEKKTVRFDFGQDLGDGALPRFAYGLVPASDWKGSIGSARLTLQFPEMTTPDQIVSADPTDPTFDGTSVTWLFLNHEAPINPSLTIVRPSLWDDLNNKRRAAQQNPGDANARAAVGGLLRQLALIDSPRRDAFYAQAVAELETAVRLDPNQRSSRQALASLYESRAGPPAGPRQPAYVLLAVAQWEPLASGDANVRKQLAEDYFYLGLDAQTRGAFADAAGYYAKAQSSAPGGAGPLFTPDHLAGQRRALNIAWARSLVDLAPGDAASARDKARAALGDQFMASFSPPPFYVSQAHVTMAPTSRQMLFVLTPLAASSAELQNTLSGAAAALRAAGGDVSFDQTSLSITVPFENRDDLTGKLAALSGAVPDRAEWALVRGILSPHDVAWEEVDKVVTHETSYREEVDLSSACGAFAAESAAVAKNLLPLDSAAPNDDEAQLKRALLKSAQDGWQSAQAQSGATYQAGSNETRVEPCAAQVVTLSTATFLPVRVALIVGMIEVVGIGILIIRWIDRRRRA